MCQENTIRNTVILYSKMFCIEHTGFDGTVFLDKHAICDGKNCFGCGCVG